MTLPWEDVEVAVQTGELDGIAWSGITEDYTVGWADVTDYFLTNNISGAWIGSWFVNEERWADLPEHLKAIVMAATEAFDISYRRAVKQLSENPGAAFASSILEEQAESVMHAFSDMFDLDTPQQQQEWMLISGRRKP